MSWTPKSPAERDRKNGRMEKQFVGSLLMAVGGIIVALCGTCTLILGAQTLHGNPAFIVVLLIVGGIPTAVGAILLLIGRGMYRESQNNARGQRGASIEGPGPSSGPET